MDRKLQRLPTIQLSDNNNEFQCLPQFKNYPLEELLYMVDTQKMRPLNTHGQTMSIIDFWCWCDQFISLKWFRSYSKFRSVGYKFKGHWFINPSKTNSFYIVPVDSTDSLVLLRQYALNQFTIPINPFINVYTSNKPLPNYLKAIQYFQSEMKNSDNGILIDIFDKNDTFTLSIERITLTNNLNERQRTIMRKQR